MPWPGSWIRSLYRRRAAEEAEPPAKRCEALWCSYGRGPAVATRRYSATGRIDYGSGDAPDSLLALCEKCLADYDKPSPWLQCWRSHMPINLGDLARDTITGYQGIVIARTEWLHGCRRLCLQAPSLHDGKPIDSATFDEPQLVLVKPGVAQSMAGADAAPASRTGGPRPEPQRHTDGVEPAKAPS